MAGVHPQWIHKLIYSGVLKARKIGPAINDDKLVDVASLKRYITEREAKKASAK